MPTIGISIALAVLIIMSLLYGSGVLSRQIHLNTIRKRWQKPLLIGVLDDITWNEQNPVATGTNLKADDWKEELERCAKELNIAVEVHYVE